MKLFLYYVICFESLPLKQLNKVVSGAELGYTLYYVKRGPAPYILPMLIDANVLVYLDPVILNQNVRYCTC